MLYNPVSVREILRLPWSLAEASQDDKTSKSKIKALSIASVLDCGTEGQSYYDILECALKDEDSCVNVSAVLAIPVFSKHMNSTGLRNSAVELL